MASTLAVKLTLNGLSLRGCSIARTLPLIGAPARTVTNKHYDPKWRKQRAQKVIWMDLPDWQKIKRESALPPDEMRAHMKKEKQLPPRSHQERNIIISSTSDVFEPYVPPEGDGLASPVSGKRAQQTFGALEKKSKSFLQLRKIKQFEEDFDSGEFARTAQDAYVDAHNLLQDVEENEDRLHELITEKAYPEMTWELRLKTLRWRFVESVEPPRIVHVRQTDLMSKDNVYGQITVRLHTRQEMALYDRFGRLMYGAEGAARDCLEYVVFEKHLSDLYGRWRIHGKLRPEWQAAPPPVYRTLRMDGDIGGQDGKEGEVLKA